MNSLNPTTKISMSALQFITIIGVLVGFGWLCSQVLNDIKTEINSVKTEIALIKMQLEIKGY